MSNRVCLTCREFSEALERRVSPKAIYRRVVRRTLPHLRIGPSIRLLLGDIESALGSGAAPEGARTIDSLFAGQAVVPLKEVASALGLCQLTAARYAQQGILPAEKISGRWWVDAERLRQRLHEYRKPAHWEWRS